MLQNQIGDLGDLAANLSTRNYELKEEIKDLQIPNSCFKTLVEELQKGMKNIQDTLQQREGRLKLLEHTNKTPKNANKHLTLQINDTANPLAVYEGYQAVTEVLRKRSEAQKTKNCAQYLKDILESAQQQYKKEKQQTSQLQEALGELSKIWESQRNDGKRLKGELEKAEKCSFLWRNGHTCWLPVGLQWQDRDGNKMMMGSSLELAGKRLWDQFKDLTNVLSSIP